jgi:hypothetical protein
MSPPLLSAEINVISTRTGRKGAARFTLFTQKSKTAVIFNVAASIDDMIFGLEKVGGEGT